MKTGRKPSIQSKPLKMPRVSFQLFLTRLYKLRSLCFVAAFFFTVAVIYVIDIIVRLIGLGWSSYSANGWNIFDIIVAGGSLITTLIVLLGANSFAITQLQKLFITSIAFKLVQRTNSLNKLFKTAV